jgi:hypothetical protein
MMTTTKLHTFALLGALSLLSGCASQATPPVSAGVLKPDWQPAQHLRIDLEGRSYSGEWNAQTCHTDACRGSFRNVKRHERNHVAQGKAQLTSADGARLDCEWTSFRAQIEGVCNTPDGRLYTLRLKD